MSDLSKRRQMYVRQIRRNEQDLIKSKIRAKLLADECYLDTKDSQYAPFENGNIMTYFYQQMMHLIASTFHLKQIQDFNFGFALTTFINSIKEVDHPQGITRLTESYRTAKSLIHKHLDLISTNEYPNICNIVNYSKEINKWSSIFNIVLLHITLKSREFPVEIMEVEGFFNLWLDKTLEDLEAFQYDYNLEGKDINFTLKEIYSLFENQLVCYKIKEPRDLLKKIFSNRMIELFVSSLNNLLIDDTCRLTIIQIFVQLTKRGIRTIYHRIIDHDFLEYIRRILDIRQGYMTKRKLSQNQENQTQIVRKMCEFINYAAELYFSDIFWQRYVCFELKEMQRSQMANNNTRYPLISTIFICITSIRSQKTLDLIWETDIFDWVLAVIDQLIDQNSSNLSTKKLIDEGVYVIDYFLEIGTKNMSRDDINPYKIKLQYSNGESILARCDKGRQMLQNYDFETDVDLC